MRTGKKNRIAIACGGTGGHLFPGVAVGEALVQRGCEVQLLVSRKEIDRQSISPLTQIQMSVSALSAVGLSRHRALAFFGGAWKSYRECLKLFRQSRPQAVLTMGGFTGTGPILAGRKLGALTFLHESNAVPGRANRWLSGKVDWVFVGFGAVKTRFKNENVMTTGTPVRNEMQQADRQGCRQALGLRHDRPLLVIQGGSQGAHAVNEQVLGALPELARAMPDLQYLHLTGNNDLDTVRNTYRQLELTAQVKPFLTEMDLALNAATLVISRAGASSLSELAAMRRPSLLIPYPHATDNHQYWNARSLADRGGAVLLEEKEMTPALLARQVLNLLQDPAELERMEEALTVCHAPHAAQSIARKIISLLPEITPETPGFSIPHVEDEEFEPKRYASEQVLPTLVERAKL